MLLSILVVLKINKVIITQILFFNLLIFSFNPVFFLLILGPPDGLSLCDYCFLRILLIYNYK